MVVTTLKVDELVRWRATERSDPDWVNTEIEWKIFREATKRFSTSALKMARGCQSVSSDLDALVLFLLSLKEFVETGKGVRILTTCRWPIESF